jgi:hypothetical protein
MERLYHAGWTVQFDTLPTHALFAQRETMEVTGDAEQNKAVSLSCHMTDTRR